MKEKKRKKEKANERKQEKQIMSKCVNRERKIKQEMDRGR